MNMTNNEIKEITDNTCSYSSDSRMHHAVNDTIILKSEIYAEKISADLDSLVNSWYVKMALRRILNDFRMILQE